MPAQPALTALLGTTLLFPLQTLDSQHVQHLTFSRTFEVIFLLNSKPVNDAIIYFSSIGLNFGFL